MNKKLITLIISTLLIPSNVFADVLGNVSSSYSNDMGAYSVFHKTEFINDSVGKQTEYYIEYTPNTEALPIVADDGTQWGQSDIYTAEKAAAADGKRIIAGINGDFFSYKTGLSMGTVIQNGRLIAKVDEPQPAIGFRHDGTAFIDDLHVRMSLEKNDKSINVECLNKWYQSGYDTLFMMSDDFGASTKTSSGNFTFLICSSYNDAITVGSDITLTVDDKFDYDGDISIPKNKFVFVIDRDFGKPELLGFINELNIGDTVTLRSDYSSQIWTEAVEATSTSAGKLLTKSVISNDFFELGAAPRTAIGITDSGKVIMYAIDGRQSGYSYGIQLATLAKRLLELGCTDAINLDGGGSTVIGALLSGSDEFSVLNSPSDGNLRNVANYIFLKDYRQPTGEVWVVNTEPINSEYYLNDTLKIQITDVYDTHNFKIENPEGINISVENADYDNQTVTFNRLGNVVINIANKKIPITVHRQYFADIDGHWAKSSILAMSDNEIINGIQNGSQFIFSPDSQMTRSEFAAVISRFIKADISEYNNVTLPFADTEKIQPWAVPYIKIVYGSNIMSGKSNDGGKTLYFDPDSSLTRAEAMTVLKRITNLPAGDYVDFKDKNDIQPWAYDGISALVNAGIVNGYSDGTIKPDGKITRAEGTAMLYKCKE